MSPPPLAHSPELNEIRAQTNQRARMHRNCSIYFGYKKKLSVTLRESRRAPFWQPRQYWAKNRPIKLKSNAYSTGMFEIFECLREEP
eukprot:scaffold148320_cov11-Prasinocladus_malaysianus.AAC.1